MNIYLFICPCEGRYNLPQNILDSHNKIMALKISVSNQTFEGGIRVSTALTTGLGAFFTLVSEWTAEGTAAKQDTDTKNHQLTLGSQGMQVPFKN